MTTGLIEREKCPRCGVRSIFVNTTLRIKDCDGNVVVVKQWEGLTVECKCGSHYAVSLAGS